MDDNFNDDKSKEKLEDSTSKKDKQKSISKILSLVSTLIIVIGICVFSYYIYHMNTQSTGDNKNIAFEDIIDVDSDSDSNENDDNTENQQLLTSGKTSDSEENAEISDESKKDDNSDDYIPDFTSSKTTSKISKTTDTTTVKNEGSKSVSSYTEKADSSSKRSTSSSSNDKSSSRSNDDSSSDDDTEAKRSVTISITGKDDEEILSPKKVKITESQTVAKVLQAVCSKYNISLKSKGSGKTYYVKSIAGLSEKADGSGSGWMVRVNGVLIDVSAGAYKLKNNDNIEWFYFSGELDEIPTF